MNNLSISSFLTWLLLPLTNDIALISNKFRKLTCHKISPIIFGRVWGCCIYLSWSLRPSRAQFFFEVISRIQLFDYVVAHGTLAIIVVDLDVFDRISTINFPGPLLISGQSGIFKNDALSQLYIGRLHIRCVFWNWWDQCLSYSILLWYLRVFICVTLLLFLSKLFKLWHVYIITIIWAWILCSSHFQHLLDRLSLKHIGVLIALRKQVLSSIPK